MTIATQLEKLASLLLSAATEESLPGVMAESHPDNEELTTKEKVEIFKAVSAWHLGVSKTKKGDADDDLSGTFTEMKHKINGKGATQ